MNLVELASGRQTTLWVDAAGIALRAANPHISGDWITWFANGSGRSGDEYIYVCEIREGKRAPSETSSRAYTAASSAEERAASIEATGAEKPTSSVQSTWTPAPEAADVESEDDERSANEGGEGGWLPWLAPLAVTGLAVTGLFAWARTKRSV